MASDVTSAVLGFPLGEIEFFRVDRFSLLDRNNLNYPGFQKNFALRDFDFLMHVL